jgi:hypothetical protein
MSMFDGNDTVNYTVFVDVDSEALDGFYYNANTREAVVDYNDDLYLYSDVSEDWASTLREANEDYASSVGREWLPDFKRNNGPGKRIGDWVDTAFERVDETKPEPVTVVPLGGRGAVGMPQAFTPKDLVDKTEPTPASAERKYSVVVSANGNERNVTLTGVSVRDVLNTVDELSAAFDLTFEVLEVARLGD